MKRLPRHLIEAKSVVHASMRKTCQIIVLAFERAISNIASIDLIVAEEVCGRYLAAYEELSDKVYHWDVNIDAEDTDREVAALHAIVCRMEPFFVEVQVIADWLDAHPKALIPASGRQRHS
jgi:hypothetical protein